MSTQHLTDTLMLTALLAVVLALSACAALSLQPGDHSRDCNASYEEPYQVCDTSVG